MIRLLVRRNSFVLTLPFVLAGLASAEPASLSAQLEAGYFDLTGARSSAKAVFDGSAGDLILGVGMRAGLGSGFFLGGRIRRFAKDGERVFVADKDSPAFRLGHPLTLRLVPVDLSLGYRFGARGAFRPYAGVGGGIVLYRERSTVAGLSQSDSRSRPSGHVLAGLEWGHGSVRLAAELGYSIVPRTLGLGGVSKVYEESDVGGLTVTGKVLFGGR